MVTKSDIYLKKLAGISAWVLLAGVIVLIVSGWGITQTGIIYRLTGGLIDWGLADAIHRTSILPLIFFFLVHVLINIKLAISIKYPSRAWFTNLILIIIVAGFMSIAVYMEYFPLGG